MIKLFLLTPILLFFSSSANSQSLSIPETKPHEKITFHTAYFTSYSHRFGQPLWVAYELYQPRLIKVAKRPQRFKTDPLISPETVNHNDYTHSGFDRGHLAPAADMAWSSITMKESFFTSNISPQRPRFNRGIWKKLETKIRSWASDESHLFIVTGPVFDSQKNHIGKSQKIKVPAYFFKAVLDTAGNDKCIAFLFPNQKSNEPLTSFAMSVDKLESLLNRDLFPMLDDAVEEKIEASFNYLEWD